MKKSLRSVVALLLLSATQSNAQGFAMSANQWSIPSGGEITNNANHRFRYLSRQAFGSDNNGSMSYALMDMDGDGKTDLVSYNEIQSGVATVYSPVSNPYWKVWLNTGSGFSANPINWSIPTGGEITNNANHRFRYMSRQAFGSDNNGSMSYATMDINGDAKPDLVAYNEIQSGEAVVFSPASNPYWKVWLNTGSGFSASPINWSIPTGGEITNNANHRFRYLARQAFTSDNNGSMSYALMDMDGDGKTDLVSYNEIQSANAAVYSPASNPYWKVWLNTGTGFSANPINWSIPTGGEITNNANHRYRYMSRQAFGSDNNGSMSYATMDINGDKKPDLVSYNEIQSGTAVVYSPASNPYWKVFLNTGSGFAASASNWSLPNGGEITNNANHRYRYLSRTAFGSDNNGSMTYELMDLDGDGKIDLVSTNEIQSGVANVYSPASNPYWKLFTNTGSGFSASNINWTIPSGGEITNNSNFRYRYSARQAFGSDNNGSMSYAVLDMNGDGKQDLVSYNEIQSGTAVVYSPASNPYWKIYYNEAPTTVKQNTLDRALLTVYPNPATDHLVIQNVKDNESFTITDVLGKVVFTGTCNGSPSLIDIHSLHKGVYIIKTESDQLYFKFIKE